MSIAPTVINPRLEAALSYACMGWRVMPLHWPKFGPGTVACSCRDPKCGSVGKHPVVTNGSKDATTNPATIRGWWEKWPIANVGIATGAESGLAVLDVDPRHGGNETLAGLMDEHGELPETIAASTGSGGAHLFFKHPGCKFPNSANKIGPGIDTRGEGGYVVAAPSKHASGECYAWEPLSGPTDRTPCTFPHWMLGKVILPPKPAAPTNREPSSGETGTRWLGKALARCNAGNRNDTGLWLATQIRDAGLSLSETERLMLDYAARCPQGDSPYAEKEALATAQSAFSRPARTPAKGQSFAAKVIREVVATTAPVKPPGASAELKEFMGEVIARRIYNVPWPWPVLTKLTNALFPGTITAVCGDPGVGKTFFVLDCLRFWFANGMDAVVFFIEKDRKFYTRRLLAQLEGNGNFADLTWAPDNADLVEAAQVKYAGMIDELGKRIHTKGGQRVTLDDLLAWIRQQAFAGNRIIVIDPITAAAAGDQRWTKDEDFMDAAQAICTAHGCSLVLVTHPRKGNRPGSPTGHDMAAGAAYYRLSDSAIWIHKPKKLRKVKYQTIHGPTQGRVGLFFQLHKTREAKGAGMELVYAFGEGLRFVEQGIVLADLPEDEQEAA